MDKLTLKDLAEILDAPIDEKYWDIEVTGFSKDTRTLEKGDLYLPFVGERVDGHDLIDMAIEKGASSALWQEDHDFANIDFPIIVVDDVLVALQKIAKGYRARLSPLIFAITGSNGKTTTKDMLKAILEKSKNTIATLGNQNNEIGLPLTILRMDKKTEAAVIEMGTESFGEINLLTDIARPHLAAITNIGDSHLELLKSKENIALEKLDIIKGLDKDGIFIYNLDDEVLVRVMKDIDIQNKCISFGTNPKAVYHLEKYGFDENQTKFTVNGRSYTINSLGYHQAINATCAIALAKEAGISEEDIKEGLENISFTKMRNELIKTKNFTIFDDSYKSNPQNLGAAIKTMASLSGYKRKIAIIGDMLALGDSEEVLHREVKNVLVENDIDEVILYGPLMKYLYDELEGSGIKRSHFLEKARLLENLNKASLVNSIILVKGSRAMRMEEIVCGLKEIGDM